MAGMFGQPQMASGAMGERTSAEDSFFEKLFSGGQFTGFGDGGKTPAQRGENILSLNTSAVKTPAKKQLGLPSLTDTQGLFAAGIIQDAFKRINPARGKLAQVQAATKPFAPNDLLGLDQRGAGGFDPVAAMAEASAIDKAAKERDRVFRLLEQVAKRDTASTKELKKGKR